MRLKVPNRSGFDAGACGRGPKRGVEWSDVYPLIDQLAPGQLAAVVRLLETMAYDDEDEALTGEDRQAVAASREYSRRNSEGGVPFEQAVADLGFTVDQVRGSSRAPVLVQVP